MFGLVFVMSLPLPLVMLANDDELQIKLLKGSISFAKLDSIKGEGRGK